ncbi:MAG: hypothetical protein AB1649_26750 [Chloroflexota bacterium]
MTYRSLVDWFTERERKMNPLVFIIEWIFIFVLSLIAGAFFFLGMDKLNEAVPVSTASSALLAIVSRR